MKTVKVGKIEVFFGEDENAFHAYFIKDEIRRDFSWEKNSEYEMKVKSVKDFTKKLATELVESTK